VLAGGGKWNAPAQQALARINHWHTLSVGYLRTPTGFGRRRMWRTLLALGLTDQQPWHRAWGAESEFDAGTGCERCHALAVSRVRRCRQAEKMPGSVARGQLSRDASSLVSIISSQQAGR